MCASRSECIQPNAVVGALAHSHTHSHEYIGGYAVRQVHITTSACGRGVMSNLISRPIIFVATMLSTPIKKLHLYMESWKKPVNVWPTPRPFFHRCFSLSPSKRIQSYIYIHSYSLKYLPTSIRYIYISIYLVVETGKRAEIDRLPARRSLYPVTGHRLFGHEMGSHFFFVGPNKFFVGQVPYHPMA